MRASAPLPSSPEVLIVGAGLSGLSCASHLMKSGVAVHVLDAADDVGGLIRTDEVDGFLLDRGFQVLLTAYEEVQAQVDLASLDLKGFEPGSLVWTGESLEHLADPWRNPTGMLASLRADVGGLGDKMKMASLRHRLLKGTVEDCFAGPDRTTLSELRSFGFSETFIDRFFRPFLGGVFLERELETSAHLFQYYFRCFAAGDAMVPAKGMQRLPDSLAAPLEGRISLGTTVGSVRADGVQLDDGSTIDAGQVVVAVDGAAAARLLGGEAPAYKAAVTTYFAADAAPRSEPLLILDGEGTGPANHVAVMSAVSPDLAPAGRHLVSVSGVGAAADDADAFEAQVPAQLRRWFGASVDRWEVLRTYRIAHALPAHLPGTLDSRGAQPTREDGLVVAGDYTQFGAIQGALLSGRRAAEAVLARR